MSILGKNDYHKLLYLHTGVFFINKELFSCTMFIVVLPHENGYIFLLHFLFVIMQPWEVIIALSRNIFNQLLFI